MKGFSLDAYRNANKFKLIDGSSQPQNVNASKADASNNPAPAEKFKFEAYYMGGNTLNINLDTEDYMRGIEDAFRGMSGLTNLAVKAIGSAFNFDLSTAIDFNYSPFLRGMKPMEFSYDTLLVVKDSYENDIKKPIRELLDYCVPTYGVGITKEKYEEMVNPIGEFIGSGWQGSQRAFDTVVNAFKGARMLVEPPQFKNVETNYIQVGTFTWKNLLVTGIKIDLGPNVYEDETDGNVYPAYAKVRLDISAMRKPVRDNITMFL